MGIKGDSNAAAIFPAACSSSRRKGHDASRRGSLPLSRFLRAGRWEWLGEGVREKEGSRGLTGKKGWNRLGGCLKSTKAR